MYAHINIFKNIKNTEITTTIVGFFSQKKRKFLCKIGNSTLVSKRFLILRCAGARFLISWLLIKLHYKLHLPYEFPNKILKTEAIKN